MTPEELAAIRARAEAATPGPWRGVPGRYILPDDWNHRYTAHQVIEGCIYNPNAENDHAFIAHAREDIPALVAEVERLQAELARLRPVVEAARVYYQTTEWHDDACERYLAEDMTYEAYQTVRTELKIAVMRLNDRVAEFLAAEQASGREGPR